jgi:hypothetical protein
MTAATPSRRRLLHRCFSLAPRRRLEPIDLPVKTLRLGVNINHIATLRQARYATMPDSKNAEPDPMPIAGICERAGAHGITAHLRVDGARTVVLPFRIA